MKMKSLAIVLVGLVSAVSTSLVTATTREKGVDPAKSLSDPSNYNWWPDIIKPYINYQQVPLRNAMIKVGLLGEANAEKALKKLKTASSNPNINQSYISSYMFLDLAKDEAHLDCERIFSSWGTVMQAYRISSCMQKYITGNYAGYIKHYGKTAYGYCARKLNEEFADSTEILGEQALDILVAFTSGPELELEQCSNLSSNELFKRARQIDLETNYIKVMKIVQAVYKIKGSIIRKPINPSEASIVVLRFLEVECNNLGKSFGTKLGVMSMVHELAGESGLLGFQPRILKLYEYRRICTPLMRPYGDKATRMFLKNLYAAETKMFFGSNNRAEKT